jgi:enoyl reductase
MKALISLVAAGLLLLGNDPTTDPGGGAGVNQSGTKGQDFEAFVKGPHSTRVFGDGVKGGKGDGFRMKRPCWYEPFLNANDMIKFQTDSRTQSSRILADERSHVAFIQQFLEKKDVPGTWWLPTYNTHDPGGAACWAGLQQFVFAPPNTTPPSGITLEQLAEIARAAMTVPEHTIKLNPDAKSFVNLPTYVWLEGIGQPRRTVTAEVPGFMSVTVVATLQDIKIDPGTTKERAETQEEGCGASGKPYVKGGAFTCGVRYLRSSIDQPRGTYPLTVSAVWPVAVAGNVVPFQLAPVELETTRNVPVGEIQSNVKP